MTHSVFDLIIAVILLFSISIGWVRGLIREVFTIVGLGTAGYATWKGGPLLVPYMNKWFDVHPEGEEQAVEVINDAASVNAGTSDVMEAAVAEQELIFGMLSHGMAAKLCAYGGVFVVVFLFFALLSYYLSQNIEDSGLNTVDKTAGGAFGFARGFAFVFLPYMALYIVKGGSETMPKWITNSTSGAAMERTYEYIDEKYNLQQYISSDGHRVSIETDPAGEAFEEIGMNMEEAEQELQDALDREELSREEQSYSP